MFVKTDLSRMFHKGDKKMAVHLQSVITLKIQAYLCKKCCKQQYSKEALFRYNLNPKGIIIFPYDDKHLTYIYGK